MQSNQCQSNESHVENVSKKSLIRTQPFFMYAILSCVVMMNIMIFCRDFYFCLRFLILEFEPETNKKVKITT